MQHELTDKQAQKVSEELAIRSRECERGILATRMDGQAGFALVGPDSILWAVVLVPGVTEPFDFWMN